MLKKFIGDKLFYKKLFMLMIPIMVQNGITNFVNMLDNVMIGAVGTAQMTGVAITNQILFVFTLCIFGAVSGAGIFGAQFFGKRDYEGVRHTFRFKLMFGGLLCIGAIILFYFFGENLIELYIKGEESGVSAVDTLGFAKSYLNIMLIGLLPFTIVQCYSSTLREDGKPTLPMVGGIVAVCVNITLNYVLIFGKFGAPALGVEGAAIATVISRFAEILVVVLYTHIKIDRYVYMRGAYKSLYVPMRLVGQLLIKGLPLMLNETFWAAGIAVVNQCYSSYGLDAVAAVNISQTFWNLFSIAFLATGNAIAIIIGQLLGANKLAEAKQSSYKLIAFSFMVSVVFGGLYFVCANFIPYAYNTEPQIRHLATIIMQITAVAMPLESLVHASYFTLRSGGKMIVTILFDCVFFWCVNVVLAFVLSHFTSIGFITLFAVIQSILIVKTVIGILLVRSGFWVKKII